MIYKTDLHCTKNEFAYFIKFQGQLFCIATTHIAGFWAPGELADISMLDLEPIDFEKFMKPSVQGKCKVSLSKELIEAMHNTKPLRPARTV